jgi:putative ABC transport system permease protein
MGFFRLVFANLFRNKVRTVLTTLSVFVALFLFCALRGLTDTLQDTIDVGDESRLITRNKTSLVFPLPMSQLERLKAIPGVAAVTWSNWFGGTDPVDPRNFYAQFAIDAPTYLPMYQKTDLEIVDASPSNGLPVPPGVDPRLGAFMNEQTAAIVGEGLMKKMGWKLGQTIRITGTIYPGSWPFVIRAVYHPKVPAVGDETVFFHWNYLYENTNHQAMVGVWSLELTDPSRAGQIMRTVDAAFENSAYPTRTETERAFQAGFISMMGNIPFVIRVLGGAIAFAILLVAMNTMMMAIRERTGEFAVMKTLGFSDSYLFRLVFAEAALITLLGGVAGALLAKFAIEGGGMRLPFFPPMSVHWDTVVTGILLAAFMGAASGIVPAYQAARLRIVDALRRVA